MPYLPILRLFFDNGIFNDYRLRDGKVEFRSKRKAWRTLSESDLRLHFRLNTEVARWLLRNYVRPEGYLEECDQRSEPTYSAAALLDFFRDFPPD